MSRYAREGIHAAYRATILCLVWMGPLTAQEVIELPSADRWLEPEFEELYRIGAIAGEEWEQFGNVRTVAFDGSGRLHVFDSQIDRIFVVGLDGNLIRQIGRDGEGPGDFRNAADMAVMEDGRIVVPDLGHRAYQVFDSNGDFVRMVRMGGDPSFAVVGIHIAQRGTDAVITTPVGGGRFSTSLVMPDGRPPQRDSPTSRPIVRVSLAGEMIVTDTIADGWLPPEREAQSAAAISGVSLGLPRRFELSPGLHWGVLPDGTVAFSDSTTYAIKIGEPSTGVSRILTRPFAPEPMTDGLIRAEKDRRLADLEAIPDEELGGGSTVINGEVVRRDPEVQRRQRRERIENLQFFYEVPVLRGLGVSWNGTIWVQRRGGLPTSDGPVDLLATDGSYWGSYRTGTTAIPDAFGPNGLAAFIETGELGLQTVVVKRFSLEGS